MNLIQGDCREVMKEFPDNSFDIVLTSPPFKDEDVQGDYWQFYDEFFQEALRVADKAVLIIHSSTKMNDVIARYPPKRSLMWIKGVMASSWRFNPIFVYQKSDRYKVNRYIWTDTIIQNPIKGINKVHPYQDPDTLYYDLLKMFKGCRSVLDPFCGSGTTLRACEELGLYGAGIDINPAHLELCKSMKIGSRQIVLTA
jgi:site-specific DNA-methyltransferase (adenine-specific)